MLIATLCSHDDDDNDGDEEEDDGDEGDEDEGDEDNGEMVIMMVVTVMSDDDGGDSDSDDDDVKKITHTHKKNILSQLIITNDIYIVTNLESKPGAVSTRVDLT